MNKKQPSKSNTQEAPAATLQASPGDWREPDKPKASEPSRPTDWNHRYVDSRLKQFCLR